MQTVQITKWR